MVDAGKNLVKSYGRRKQPRPIDSHNHNTNNKLSQCTRRAPRFASWLARAAIDFLIEDRCVICGDISRPIQARPDSTALFSHYIAAAVNHNVFGPMHIENHPVCGACSTSFDETLGPGTMTIAGGEPEDSGIRVPVISPFMTSDPVLELVHLIKFSAYTALVRPAARSIRAAYERYQAEAPDPRVLVPVPMHPRQQRMRGFNQAEMIARVLSPALDIPCLAGCLVRCRAGMRQSATPREKRAANVEGAFSTRKGPIAGKHVLLVDDLVTTGATASACSRALLSAGAASVTVLCLGRSL